MQLSEAYRNRIENELAGEIQRTRGLAPEASAAASPDAKMAIESLRKKINTSRRNIDAAAKPKGSGKHAA